MLRNIILLLLLSLESYAGGCWTPEELSKMAHEELDGKASISIKDAITCKPVAGAKFSLGTMHFQADENGIVKLPLPPEDLDMKLPVKIEKEKYITADESIYVVFGNYFGTEFLISEDLPVNGARFVLSWGNKPDDLDLHLKSDSYHISYRKTRNIKDKVKLDRDAMKGFGPETITLNELKKDSTYRVIVHRLSSTGSIDKKTQVRVYLNNRLDRSLRLDNTLADCIEVATIKQNRINYETKVLDTLECR